MSISKVYSIYTGYKEKGVSSMQIIQTNLSHNESTIKYQPVLYKNREFQNDTFVRSKAHNPSFKAGGENIYSKILSNPQKAEQFMGLIAAGAAALIAAATVESAGKEHENPAESGNVFTNFFSGLFRQNQSGNIQESEINKYKEENERLKKENETLKEKLNINLPKEEKSEEPELIKASFPKKRGRLTQNQQNLKSIIEQINLSEKTAAKLTAICTELFTKNSHSIDNQIKDNDTITKDLTEELKSSGSDIQKIEQIIEKYMIICEATSEKNKSESEKESQIHTKGQEDSKLKIVGKIDLTALQKIPERIVRDSDGNIQCLFFKKAGAIPEYSTQQLDDIFKYFVKTIYNDYKDRVKINPDLEKPKWLYNIPVPQRIRKSDITREVKKQCSPDERYENIINADYQYIVDAINEDYRYSELFDIHSALRLFDRFVDFNSDNLGIDVQSKRIMDKLFELIEKGYKEGLQVKVYKDKKSGYIGPSIILSAEKFDKEALDIFGSADIVIGISERQRGKSYKGVDNNRKEAVISTIYSKSM